MTAPTNSSGTAVESNPSPQRSRVVVITYIHLWSRLYSAVNPCALPNSNAKSVNAKHGRSGTGGWVIVEVSQRSTINGDTHRHCVNVTATKPLHPWQLVTWVGLFSDHADCAELRYKEG